MMEIRQGAGVRMGGQVVHEPSLLCAPGLAGDMTAVGIERDQVPRGDVVAVVPLRRVAGGGTEIPEVPARVVPAVGAAGGVVFVIAHSRVGDRLHGRDAPRGIVGLHERGCSSALVLLVAEREDRSEASGGQLGSRVLLMAAGVGPVPTVETGILRVTRDVTRGCDYWNAGR